MHVTTTHNTTARVTTTALSTVYSPLLTIDVKLANAIKQHIVSILLHSVTTTHITTTLRYYYTRYCYMYYCYTLCLLASVLC